MSAPANIAAAGLVPLADAFRLRCWARAYLVHAGEIDLHAAVDVLQADAESHGLVDLVGQDTVQAIMADEFRGVRDAG